MALRRSGVRTPYSPLYFRLNPNDTPCAVLDLLQETSMALRRSRVRIPWAPVRSLSSPSGAANPWIDGIGILPTTSKKNPYFLFLTDPLCRGLTGWVRSTLPKRSSQADSQPTGHRFFRKVL